MDQPDITLLEEKAIKAALNNSWELAVNLNEQIINDSPKNTPSLNRLGMAYIKTNQISLAKDIFRKVLKLSPNNPIAIKNLYNIKHQIKPKKLPTTFRSAPKIVNFIEEPGISKIVPLIKQGDPQTMANLEIGQNVILKLSARKIKVFTSNTNEYIGRLPDNLSLSLSKFIKLGYKYQTYVKSINPQSPQIFIQETKRSKRLKGIPSFTINNNNAIDVPILEPVNPPLEIFDPLTTQED
jgi:tetratricopeptide (TPR) repeat protein